MDEMRSIAENLQAPPCARELARVYLERMDEIFVGSRRERRLAIACVFAVAIILLVLVVSHI